MADSRPFKSGTTGASETRRRSRTRKRSRLRWIVLGVIAIVFGYIYIGGSFGWYNMWKLRQQKSQLQTDLKELDSRKRVLTDELELLEGDAEEMNGRASSWKDWPGRNTEWSGKTS